jgi:hypothetical protein
MRKNAHLSVRLTENDMSKLKTMAAQDEIRLPDLVRRCLIAAAHQPSPALGLLQRMIMPSR